jgi:hypothetical protein
MLDYAPKTANSWSLELNSEWAEHRLNLFIPSTGHLWLYPNLHPAEVTAGKFAAAILPEPGMRREDYLFLLLPGFDEKLYFILLRKDSFCPLTEAFRWVLDIEASTNLPAAVQAVRGRVSEAVCEAVDGNLFKTVQQQATAALDIATTALKAKANMLEKELEERENRLSSLAETAKAQMDTVNKISTAMESVEDEFSGLTTLLGKIQTEFGTTKSNLSEIRNLIEKHDSLERSLQELAAKVNDIRQMRQ